MNYQAMVDQLKKTKSKYFTRSDLFMERLNQLGYGEISPTSLISYNLTSNSDLTETPKEDGTFDVMGTQTVDVYGTYFVKWWQRRHWHTIKTSFSTWVEYIQEFVITGFYKRLFKYPSLLLKNIYTWVFKYNPLVVKMEAWIWVIDSIESSLEGFVSDKVFSSTQSTLNRNQAKEKVRELLATQKQELFNEMLKEYNMVQVSPFLFVNENDPTVMMVDESYILYDMRDGWSAESLCKIIAYWVRIFYSRDVEIRLKK